MMNPQKQTLTPSDHRRNPGLRRFGAGILGILSLLFSTAAADEPVREFLEGLRQREFHDTAVEYLTSLEARTDLPPETRAVLPLERGITFAQLAARAGVPEDREQYIAQAEAALRQFVDANSEHPEAPSANSQLAELLFQRAQNLIWESDGSGLNDDRRNELRLQARSLINGARDIYSRAKQQYEDAYNSFPAFIDRNEDEDQYREREIAESRYLTAWFQLVRCPYELGKTFPAGSPERTETLTQAAQQFEEIYNARRSNVIGRHARVMMGKCFQEQGDLVRALGLYKEVLDDQSTNPLMKRLRDTTRHYRLICLNDPGRNDYQRVVIEANEWLAENRGATLTEAGLGIRWEKAVALEKLSEERTLSDGERETLLRQATAEAQQVARINGPFRQPAQLMLRRLQAALGDKDREPRDFATAFERARGLVAELTTLQQKADAAGTAEERQAVQAETAAARDEMGRLFELALTFADEDTDPAAVAQARYLLSYVYTRQEKFYDAVILATHCLTHDRAADQQNALNATEVAIEAAVQAYNAAPADDNDFELNLLKDVCRLIIDEYPQSARGNEARIRLGRVHVTLDEPMQAVDAFLQVPKTDAAYPTARLLAGRSALTAWDRATRGEPIDTPQQPEAAATDALRTQAVTLLKEGIALSRERIGAEAPPTDEIVDAETALAVALNAELKFDETVQRLTSGGNQSVLTQVEVADGEARPETGIRSRAFAATVYRLLLRAYVGLQQIDQAGNMMDRLKTVGGDDITAVYTQLGLELQDELKRLKNAGDNENLDRVRQSFEQFLGKVFEQKGTGDFNTLLWIGETYFGLGMGIEGDPAAARGYFDKSASAYEQILAGSFPDAAGQDRALRLRLMRCRRRQGQYEEAVTLAEEILADNDFILDAQLEAAHALADWGADPTGEPQKLLTSIEGMKTGDGKDLIWGWAGITRRLQLQQQSDQWETLQDQFFEARYELSNSRLRYARTGAPDADKQLNSALAELALFGQIFGNIDESWWNRFDQLYADTLTQLGRPVEPLPRPQLAELSQEQIAALDARQRIEEEEAQRSRTPEGDVPAAPATPPTESEGLLLTVLGIALAGGAGFGVFRMMSKPRKRVRSQFASGASPPVPAGPIPGSSGKSDDVPDFSGLTVSEKPRPVRTGAAAAGTPRKPSATGQTRQPRTQKRPAGTARPESAARQGGTARPKQQRPAGQPDAGGTAPRKKAAPADGSAQQGGQKPVRRTRKRPPGQTPPSGKPPKKPDN